MILSESPAPSRTEPRRQPRPRSSQSTSSPSELQATSCDFGGIHPHLNREERRRESLYKEEFFSFGGMNSLTGQSHGKKEKVKGESSLVILGITSHVYKNIRLKCWGRKKGSWSWRKRREPAAVLLLPPTTSWKADFFTRAGCSPNKGPRVFIFLISILGVV